MKAEEATKYIMILSAAATIMAMIESGEIRGEADIKDALEEFKAWLAYEPAELDIMRSLFVDEPQKKFTVSEFTRAVADFARGELAGTPVDKCLLAIADRLRRQP